jgi:hypothetical protein
MRMSFPFSCNRGPSVWLFKPASATSVVFTTGSIPSASAFQLRPIWPMAFNSASASPAQPSTKPSSRSSRCISWTRLKTAKPSKISNPLSAFSTTFNGIGSLALARLHRENDKDEIIAMHEHDEAILENEPDFTEISSALPLPESAPNAPVTSELDATAPDEPPGFNVQSRSAGDKPTDRNHQSTPAASASNSPAADIARQPELPVETANLPPNSTTNAPSFHLFHRIPPAKKNEIPLIPRALIEPKEGYVNDF